MRFERQFHYSYKHNKRFLFRVHEVIWKEKMSGVARESSQYFWIYSTAISMCGCACKPTVGCRKGSIKDFIFFTLLYVKILQSDPFQIKGNTQSLWSNFIMNILMLLLCDVFLGAHALLWMWGVLITYQKDYWQWTGSGEALICNLS